MAVTLFLLAWVALTLTGQLFRSEESATGSFREVTRLDVETRFEAVEVVGADSATAVSVQRTWSWSLREPRTAMTQRGGARPGEHGRRRHPGQQGVNTLRVADPGSSLMHEK